MQERYEEAETFFENATCIDEKSILAWTTLGQQLLHVVTTDLNYWIKHPFEFSDPILKPEYL